MWYCPRCSRAVEVGTASCPSCGYEISRMPPAKVAAPVAPVAPVAPAPPDEPDDEPAPPPPTVTLEMQNELHALLAENRVIEAIKIYRERMQVGLKEAKDAIDEMRAAR
jgi:ribosomal protein L7/L12